MENKYSFKELADETAHKVRDGIREARTRRSVVVVITGDGKGKTTSATGMLVRARGHNLRCALFQFFKAGAESGEIEVLKNTGVEIFKAPCVCWWNESSEDELMAKINPYLKLLGEALLSGEYDLIAIDEGTYLLRPELWGVEKLLVLLAKRAQNTSVVITGRNAPQELCAVADTVSEVQAVKHAFNQGVAAQAGIEW